MRKLITCLGLLLVASAASGCTFYFGPEEDGGDTYSYCDESGCWTCYEDTGECWSSGGGPNGCWSDDDCAAACYCDEDTGVCIETGFCDTDGDCADGYVCDDRSSCVPEGDPPCWDTGCLGGQTCDAATGECIDDWLSCESDDDCAAACYCDAATGQCVESSFCDADEDCGEGMTCDEDRSTCIPGEDPVPACSELSPPNGTQADCEARADCEVVLGGVNCSPQCSADPSSPDCVCESYYYAACVDGDPASP